MNTRLADGPRPARVVPAWRAWALTLGMALLAGVYQGVATARPNNDTFLHLAMSRQWIDGDLPVRDFFDSGLVLMYVASTAAQRIFGYRLLAEAMVVGSMVTVATLIAGRLVLRLTGSLAGALVAQLLILLAAPRPYSYPKLIVYAVLAWLWWCYVSGPTRLLMVLLGVWMAAAFYFRPDHGVLAAAFVVLAIVVADGVTVAAARRLAMAGGVVLLLTLPFFVYVHQVIGFGAYLQSGMAQGRAEEVEMSGHSLPRWPVRAISDVFAMADADSYAPQVSLRWAAGTDASTRQSLLTRYHLTALEDDGEATRVRLSADAIDRVRDLINERAIADTAGIDRSASVVSAAAWPPWQRLGYRYLPFRLRILPALDQQERGSEVATILFQALPVAAVGAAFVFRRRLTGVVTPLRLSAFALATLLVNFVLIRTPYDVRTVDAVWLPAMLAGVGIGALLMLVGQRGRLLRTLTGVVVIALTILMVKSVAVAGDLNGRITWLSGEFRDSEHLRGAWSDIRDRLFASPPVEYWSGRAAPAPMQLAAYARECLAPADRLVVLWFAPEIYYYSDRLMGQRHLVFIHGWEKLAREQQLTLDKVRRAAPPLVFAKADWRESSVSTIYPGLAEYIQREYDQVAALGGGDDDVILARRDRVPVRRYGAMPWPCYAHRS